ncbi:MAG: hypothetical protein K1X29_08055 [Bdellovibrionales bacterium]|nr:hypothetical protein [Bdellovibrionales bacterium]
MIAFLMSSISNAQLLSPMLRLRTIKMRLIAQDLNASDYRWLETSFSACRNKKRNAEKDLCEQAALTGRIRLYMKSDSFLGRGMEFAYNLLAVQPATIPVESIQDDSDEHSSGRSSASFSIARLSKDALANLVKGIFSTNQSWNRFFTAGEFTTYEIEYYTKFIPSQIKPFSTQKSVPVKIENPDIAAGFMITPRFLARYFNNPVNEGRKRAAGIMRVALCDSMFPAIERGEEHKAIEVEIALGRNQSAQGPIDGAKLHGTRRDCAQCHVYRGLDHMAWTFRSTEIALSDHPAMGRFTYVRKNGELVDIPVRGIGHLARVITKQPEFLSCQVRHFWSRYVGPVRYLDEFPEKEADLVDTYKNIGGRVQDFIAYLMLRPELAMVDLPKAQLDPVFASAARVLTNCNQCHQGINPSFTILPIMKDGTNVTNYFAGRIIERLALKPYAKVKQRSMPPESSPWQPKDEDLAAILTWIQAGMPDAQGVKHLNDADIKGLGGAQ